jgi:hypothetical protein
VGFAVNDRIFTGAATVTVTLRDVAVAVTLPDALVQASVYTPEFVVCRLLIVKLLAPVGTWSTVPEGVPIAQDVEKFAVPAKVQLKVVEPPAVTVAGLALNPLTVGGVTTVTVICWETMTPSELVQLTVYWVVALIPVTGTELATAELLPARVTVELKVPPETVQDVA